MNYNQIEAEVKRALKKIQGKDSMKKVSFSRLIEVFNYFKKRKQRIDQEYRDFFAAQIEPLLQQGQLIIPIRELEDGTITAYEYSKYSIHTRKVEWAYHREHIKPLDRSSKLEWLELQNPELQLVGLALESQMKNSEGRFYYYTRHLINNFLNDYCRNRHERVINLSFQGHTFTMVQDRDGYSYTLVDSPVNEDIKDINENMANYSLHPLNRKLEL